MPAKPPDQGSAGKDKPQVLAKPPAEPSSAKPISSKPIPTKPTPTKSCPICGKPATEAAEPFCSPRCRDVDLNRWLSGSYIVPGKPEDDQDAE
jgi:endogenous inhibitor of DNA gyrase (YacG/DUF329 family)